MIDLSFFHQIFILLTISIGFWLAFWVYFVDKKNKINQLFLLFTIAMLLYLVFSYLSHSPSQIHLAILWKKLFLSVIALFLIFTYFFSVYFPKEKKFHPILDKIVLITEVLFIFLIIFTDLFVKDIEVQEWGTNITWGVGKNIWFLTMIIFTFIIVGQILKKYFILPQREKLQVQYFLIGIMIFASMNFIFNMVFPVFQNTFKYHYFGDLSAIFFLGFTAYAIVKRELFGIRVVLTAIFVASIGIVLALDALVFTPQLILQLFKGLILVVFLYFGYLLVRSVTREIRHREEIEKLSRAKSEFISIASHQLRTPPTAIKGWTSMVLEGTYGRIGKKIRTVLEKVYYSNERMIGLISDLLNVSRIESGTLELDFEKTSLDKMISSILDELRIGAGEKKLYLKWKKSKEPLPEITIDPGKIRQVIMNIIDNSIKYTEKGGITVKTEQKEPSRQWPQGSILIAIKDTGEGMTKEEIKKIFESFTRGRAGTRYSSAGLGLGLYVVRKFTELHNGKVWAESAGRNKGSTFYIELPIK